MVCFAVAAILKRVRAQGLQRVARGSGTVGFFFFRKVRSLAENNKGTRDETLSLPSFDVPATWGKWK